MSRDSKFTPGPWHWEVCRTMQHLQNSEGSCFAGVSMPLSRNKNYPPSESRKADANLIASAPELYEALTDLLETVIDSDISHPLIDKFIDKAKAALSKAEGKGDEHE